MRSPDDVPECLQSIAFTRKIPTDRAITHWNDDCSVDCGKPRRAPRENTLKRLHAANTLDAYARLGSLAIASLQVMTAALPVATFLAPSMAYAQDPGATSGTDTVVLKDGGMLKGTLIEILPGDHATMTLANGQNAKIRWDVIDHIIRNGVPLNPSQQTAPQTTQVAQPAAQDQGNVVVHVDGGDVDVEMQTMNGTPTGKKVTGTWATMCSAPCDQELPLAGAYRLAGSGVRASKSFKLIGHPGDHVTITADPSSKGSFAGGIVLISVGVPVFVIGMFVELVVGLVNLASRASGEYDDTSGAQIVGLSMMGLGTAGVITGIVLIANNGSTHLDQTIDAKKSAALATDFFKRAAVYKDHDGPKLPPLNSVPLFSGSF
jgi:hypothetical protein